MDIYEVVNKVIKDYFESYGENPPQDYPHKYYVVFDDDGVPASLDWVIGYVEDTYYNDKKLMTRIINFLENKNNYKSNKINYYFGDRNYKFIEKK